MSSILTDSIKLLPSIPALMRSIMNKVHLHGITLCRYTSYYHGLICTVVAR